MKTIITIAIVALFTVITARADGMRPKGGAGALLKAPEVKAGAPVAAMKCATCKSEFVTIKTPAFKGTVPVTTIVERHACTSCENKWVTAGYGKARTLVTVHTCGGCTLASSR